MKLEIRPFQPIDAASVKELFIAVNRSLAPPDLADRFETYITASIREEIGRIKEYYTAKNGQFWVACDADTLAGMVGVEQHSDGAMELRRMYVSSDYRRKGIARKLLDHVENWCHDASYKTLVLSTSELQPAAIRLYETSGFTFIRKTTAQTANNKTIGGGIQRRYYTKGL